MERVAAIIRGKAQVVLLYDGQLADAQAMLEAIVETANAVVQSTDKENTHES